MNIVVDTNVFISALIKDRISRYIIIHSENNFLFPEFELQEIQNHKFEIMNKANLSEKEFDVLLLRLIKYVRIIPKYIIIDYREEAQNLMESIDPDDVLFIATALVFNCPIWSDDKHFKQQNKVKILTTKDIINLEK